MAYLKSTLKLILFGIAAILPGISAAAVPHVFSAPTPIVSSEVNANFTDLDTRVTTLETTIPVFPDFSGFNMPFSADGAPKNVVVIEKNLFGGGMEYAVFTRFANSTEQVSIDGVLTIRPFFSSEAFIETDSGNNLIAIESEIETPDTLSFANFNIEESEYDTATLVKTVTADSVRTIASSISNLGSTVTWHETLVLSIDGSFVENFIWSAIQTTSGAFTVNGMTFPEIMIQVENYREFGSTVSENVVFAKGVGPIAAAQSNDFENNHLVIYYRIGGVANGSLVGTPFDTGQPLDGLFF